MKNNKKDIFDAFDCLFNLESIMIDDYHYDIYKSTCDYIYLKNGTSRINLQKNQTYAYAYGNVYSENECIGNLLIPLYMKEEKNIKHEKTVAKVLSEKINCMINEKIKDLEKKRQLICNNDKPKEESVKNPHKDASKAVFNMNNMAAVKLTKDGEKRLKEHNQYYYKCDLKNDFKHDSIPDFNPKTKILKRELWSIMNVFGDMMYMGNNKIPFVNNEITILFE